MRVARAGHRVAQLSAAREKRGLICKGKAEHRHDVRGHSTAGSSKGMADHCSDLHSEGRAKPVKAVAKRSRAEQGAEQGKAMRARRRQSTAYMRRGIARISFAKA